MRKWAEVFRNKTTGMPGCEQLAAIDVTDELDGGDSVMVDLKAAYGTNVLYHFHFCRHDDGQSCRVAEV